MGLTSNNNLSSNNSNNGGTIVGNSSSNIGIPLAPTVDQVCSKKELLALATDCDFFLLELLRT